MPIVVKLNIIVLNVMVPFESNNKIASYLRNGRYPTIRVGSLVIRNYYMTL
jgi:hypothetical protein